MVLDQDNLENLLLKYFISHKVLQIPILGSFKIINEKLNNANDVIYPLKTIKYDESIRKDNYLIEYLYSHLDNDLEDIRVYVNQYFQDRLKEFFLKGKTKLGLLGYIRENDHGEVIMENSQDIVKMANYGLQAIKINHDNGIKSDFLEFVPNSDFDLNQYSQNQVDTSEEWDGLYKRKFKPIASEVSNADSNLSSMEAQNDKSSDNTNGSYQKELSAPIVLNEDNNVCEGFKIETMEDFESENIMNNKEDDLPIEEVNYKSLTNEVENTENKVVETQPMSILDYLSLQNQSDNSTSENLQDLPLVDNSNFGQQKEITVNDLINDVPIVIDNNENKDNELLKNFSRAEYEGTTNWTPILYTIVGVLIAIILGLMIYNYIFDNSSVTIAPDITVQDNIDQSQNNNLDPSVEESLPEIPEKYQGILTPEIIKEGCVVIIGSFSEQKNIDKLTAEIKANGKTPYIETTSNGLYRVGIQFDCLETDIETYVQNMRNTYKGAWLLRPNYKVK